MKKIILFLSFLLTVSSVYSSEITDEKGYDNVSEETSNINLLAEPKSILNFDENLSKKEIKIKQKAEKEQAELEKKIEKAIKKAEEDIISVQKMLENQTEKETVKAIDIYNQEKNIKQSFSKDIKQLKQEKKQKLKEEKDAKRIKKEQEKELEKAENKNPQKIIEEKKSEKNIQKEVIVEEQNKTNTSDYKKLLKESGLKFKQEAFLKQAEENNLENVQLFIKAGMKPDVCNESGTTPLIWASFNGNTEMVKTLISSGANINIKNKDGFTPLHAAVENGNLEIVKYLITNGAKINTELYSDKTTPLHTACFKGNKEIVQILVVAGADVNAKNIHGATPVVTATFYGKKDIVNYLNTNGSNFDILSDDGKILTVSAITEGKTEAFSSLIESGIDINTQNKDGKTMLQTAINNGDTDTVLILLNKNADTNISYSENTLKNVTPLFSAVLKQNSEMVKALIKHGADIEAKESETGATPLILAVLLGNEDIVSNLIYNGANINAETISGFTVADIALAKDDYTMLKNLLKNGALFGKKTGAILVPYGCSVTYNPESNLYSIAYEQAISAKNEYNKEIHQEYNKYMKNTATFRKNRTFIPDEHAYKIYPLLFEIMKK